MIEEAINFLKENYEVSFATCENNKPKIRVFQIMKFGDKDLFFATSKKKAVYRQLQENPNIEIMAFKGKISVKCVGKANFDVTEETKRWIYEHNEVLPRLYDDFNGLEYFRMSLESIDYYDLQPTPPILKHINLSTLEEVDGFVGDKYSKQNNDIYQKKDKTYTYESIRKYYPNAYKVWTAEDDFLLIDLYKQGVSLKEISKRFQRKESAIRERILRLMK